jgi:hypothetical protein
MLDHRRDAGRRYTAYCRAIQATWGPLPEIALGTLREAGRAAVELERLGLDLEAARARHQVQDAARVRRQQASLRKQLARLEARLQAFGAERQPSDPLASVRQAVEAANR